MKKEALHQPDTSELELVVFRRLPHPELFRVLQTREVLSRGNEKLVFRITPSGHAISWYLGKLELHQVLASGEDGLPRGGRLLTLRPEEGHGGHFEMAPGWRFEAVVSVEQMNAPQYAQFHDDLESDARRRGMSLRFWPDQTGKDPWLPGLAFLTVESRPGCLVMTAFHTHPMQCRIVRIQSLIEQPQSASPRGFQPGY